MYEIVPAVAEDDDLEQGSSSHRHGEQKVDELLRFEFASKILERERVCDSREREKEKADEREKGRQFGSVCPSPGYLY